jgi:hypothetical protein
VQEKHGKNFEELSSYEKVTIGGTLRGGMADRAGHSTHHQTLTSARTQTPAWAFLPSPFW